MAIESIRTPRTPNFRLAILGLALLLSACIPKPVQPPVEPTPPAEVKPHNALLAG